METSSCLLLIHCVYVIDIKDGYIPYVEDSVYTNQSTDLDATRNLRTFGSCKLEIIFM